MQTLLVIGEERSYPRLAYALNAKEIQNSIDMIRLT